MDEVEAASSQQLEALEYVFRKAAEADMPSEFPDYLCCAITLGILQDPLITPYGHTYDKEAIIRHLEGNNFDPITGRPLDRSQLVPNLAVKKAVLVFLDKHGWAYKEFI
ncbi:hypothetical protein QN277_023235 [Acacia crassicarpa]|uniref:RING-type E3 ubiquitin transferase n=1 Tax=Acacia crassicarpa TaxID=499986 RepID=A0AAE1JGV2_9FABA|nr:hypothetical protein QN277_023235 [Acacia crassicarpa]